MKRFLALFLALSMCQASLAVPDIIIDSKLDFDWSDVLVQKLRRLLVNKGHGDPFKSRIRDEVTVADLRASELSSADARRLLEDLGEAVGLKLLNTRSRVKIKNLAYEIGSVSTEVKASHKSRSGLTVDADLSIRNLVVDADEVSLILEIPGTGGATPVLEVKVLRPVFRTQARRDLIVGASVQVIEGPKDISFQLLHSNFSYVADLLAVAPQTLSLTYQDLVVPEVAVRVGTRQLTIDPSKVRAFVRERDAQLKALIIEQLRAKLSENLTAPLSALLADVKLPREHWVSAETVVSQFKIGRIATNERDRNLEVSLPADFCTKNSFDGTGADCVNQKKTRTPPSLIRQQDHAESLRAMKDALSSDAVNLVASISEDYLNKLLGATYDAGLYNDMLAEAGAGLGDKRAFIRLDEKGDTATFYADVVYKISGFEALAVGVREIRFPLAIRCSMRIERRSNNMPVLLIRMVDADLSDDVLRNGIPELGLVSTVNRAPRFKGKLVKTIQGKMKNFLGKDVVSLLYPEFKGLGLETINFKSDGHGRLGAEVRLEELLQSAE